MRCSLLLIVCFLFVFSENLSAQKKAARLVKEIYYEVNSVGEVNRNIIIEIRELEYDKNFNFISGKSFVNNKRVELTSDANAYYYLTTYQNDKDNCDYDNNGQIIQYREMLDDGTDIIHLLRYDDHSNLLEDSFNATVLTYEYLYLSSSEHNKKGKIERTSKPKNASESWVARTIKQNGLIVQYSERKIRKER